MTEYGVLLADGTVAPCASRPHATAYSAGADRELCARPAGGEWAVVSPAAVNRDVDCLAPSHASVRRHRNAGQPLCQSCVDFNRGYDRAKRARRKEPAA